MRAIDIALKCIEFYKAVGRENWGMLKEYMEVMIRMPSLKNSASH